MQLYCLPSSHQHEYKYPQSVIVYRLQSSPSDCDFVCSSIPTLFPIRQFTMSYLHYNHTRTHERTPDYEPHHSRPAVRRDTDKHHHGLTLSDFDENGPDDYPYPSNHKSAKLSRALTVHNQPSQLERYNIWSDDKRNNEDDDRRRSYDMRRTYKYSDKHYYTDDEETDDRAWRLKIHSTLDRPSTSHHHSYGAHLWPGDALRRSDRWIDEHWESRVRSTSRERSTKRRDSFRGDFEEKEREVEAERWSRYHRTSGTKTEEIRPLSGWRRSRFIRRS